MRFGLLASILFSAAITASSIEAAERLTLTAGIATDAINDGSRYPRHLLVSVTDENGLPVDDLTASNFVVRIVYCGGEVPSPCGAINSRVEITQLGMGLYGVFLASWDHSFGAASVTVLKRNIRAVREGPAPITAFGQVIVEGAGLFAWNGPRFSRAWGPVNCVR
jgi:hypothetical protein